MRTQRRKQSENLSTQYEPLEARQLLATMFHGTSGNDEVEIGYVDASTINLTINGTLHENVDTTDGVIINLGEGLSDRVVMDDRVDSDLAIMFAEVIELVGQRDNQWKIGVKPLQGGDLNTSPNLDQTLDRLVVGRINENVTFAGVRTVMGSDGDDHFNVVTNFVYDLNIRGRAGDDLFRFVGRPTAQDLTSTNATTSNSTSDTVQGTAVGYGGGGNDRFVFRDGSLAFAEGGLGFDTVDYSLYEFKTSVFFGDDGIERVIGSRDRTNHLELRNRAEFRHSNWTVRGNFTEVHNVTDNTRVELYYFNSLQAADGFRSHDRVWVLETAEDLTIKNFDWGQVSSEKDAMLGDLSTIVHNITVDYDASSSAVILLSRPFASNPVAAMKLIVSDAGGEGSRARFVGDRIDLNDDTWIRMTPDDRRELIFHGSRLADDAITVEGLQVKTDLYTHGGDDLVMLGSTTSEASGNLGRIEAPLTLGTGTGNDHLVVNDQGATTTDRRYVLSANGLQDFAQSNNARFQKVSFNGSTETVRINAAATFYNYFHVTPSQATRFIINSGESTLRDELFIEGVDGLGALSQTDGTGSFSLDDHQRIYFEGIDEVFQETVWSDPRADLVSGH